jgi:single-strand DNA-binding protein
VCGKLFGPASSLSREESQELMAKSQKLENLIAKPTGYSRSGMWYSERNLKGTLFMAKSVNKVILVGNLGKDPEVKYTPSGTPVAKFSLATNERFKDKSGEWQDRTEWHNIVAWQRLAEIVGEYVKKGSKLYIEGRLQTSSWEDKQSGEKKYRTEVIAQDLVLLGGRGEGGDSEGRSRGAAAHASSFDQRNSQPEEVAQVDPGITDDDIPF